MLQVGSVIHNHFFKVRIIFTTPVLKSLKHTISVINTKNHDLAQRLLQCTIIKYVKRKKYSKW